MLSIYDFLLRPRSVLTNLFFWLLCGAPGRVSSVPWSRHLNHSRNCSKIENFCKQTDNTSKHTHTFVRRCVCVFIYTYIWCLFMLLIHWTLQLPQLARPASRHRRRRHYSHRSSISSPIPIRSVTLIYLLVSPCANGIKSLTLTVFVL